MYIKLNKEVFEIKKLKIEDLNDEEIIGNEMMKKFYFKSQIYDACYHTEMNQFFLKLYKSYKDIKLEVDLSKFV